MEIQKQVNKGNAQVQNIGIQQIYQAYMGSAFLPAENCAENKKYISKRDRLYYPPQYLEKIQATLTETHGIWIQGEQGCGKTILSFKLADLLKEEGQIVSAYYLNPPDSWNRIKQWIQYVRSQEEQEGKSRLWIIDNLQKIEKAAEDFPEQSVWGADYCICCSRDLDGVPQAEDIYADVTLSGKQVIKRGIDKKIFFNCFNTMSDTRIGRQESDALYQFIGGNLATLGYLIDNGRIRDYLANWDKEQAVDFSKIYEIYFSHGRLFGYKVVRENCMDVLKMLFLSQIDFSIPIYMQTDVCQTVLKDFYFENRDKELEFEHASLAEIFSKCICQVHKIDYGYFFQVALQWTLDNLMGQHLPAEERRMRTNLFLQLLFGYKFILSDNREIRKGLFDGGCLVDFLDKNVCLISFATWKKIITAAGDSAKVIEILRKHVTSPSVTDTLIRNFDYNFRFLQELLTSDEIEKMETQLLADGLTIIDCIRESKKDVYFMQLLYSVSEDTGACFLERISPRNLIGLLSGNDNGLGSFANYYHRLNEKVQLIIDSMITTEGYACILEEFGSIMGYASLLACKADSPGNCFRSLLDRRDMVCRTIQNTIDNHFSIGALGLHLRTMGIKAPELLEAFENAVGLNGYKKLLESQGTIPIFAWLIQNSSKEMQKAMGEMLQNTPDLADKLIKRTIENANSIGTLSLSFRKLKKEANGALEAFEKAVGISGYQRLLESQGTISILLRFIGYASEGMQTDLINMLHNTPELVDKLLERTIENGNSIGTLGIMIRQLKQEANGALEAFEKAVGISGYQRLLESQGTIINFLRILVNSSKDMRTELNKITQNTPDLVDKLLERTIENGDSIGTLDLTLRQLKREAKDVLRSFERAVGISGYKKLLESQGTIPILAGLINWSSKEMRTAMGNMLRNSPDLADKLVKRTIENGSSLGTLNISLEQLRQKAGGILAVFEKAVGMDGYKKLLENQGTIPILMRILEASSERMQADMNEMMKSTPQFVSLVVNNTAQKKSTLGMLNCYIRNLRIRSISCQRTLEHNIGADGYFHMFTECNANAVTVLRIMACSCISASLVDKMSKNMEFWNKLKESIQESYIYLLKDFHIDLNYAEKRSHKKFFDFMSRYISAEEWLGWFQTGAVLEDFILVLGNLPISMAQKISTLMVTRYNESLEAFYAVAEKRAEDFSYDPKLVSDAVKAIKGYNRILYTLLEKELRIRP